MIKKLAPITIIIAQIISCIWFLKPAEHHAHVPGGFIEMLIFAGIALVLLVITSILYSIYRPKTLIWKVPFVISLIMFVLAWFYNN